MNKTKAVLVVALVALVGAALGVGVRARMRAHTFTPFTITTDEITTLDGRVINHETATRAYGSAGRMHEVRRYDGGGTEEHYAEPGRGFFKVGREASEFVGYTRTEPPPALTSMEALRANDQFVREDSVLGVPVAVLRAQQSPDSYELLSVAPSLNGEVVEREFHVGGKVIKVTPLSITVGEPDPAAMQHPDRPERRDLFDRAHGGR